MKTDDSGPLRRSRASEDVMEPVSIVICESDPVLARRIRVAFRMVANEVIVLESRQEVEDFAAGRGPWEDGGEVPDVLIVDVDMLERHCPHTLTRLRKRAGETGRQPLIVALSGEPTTEERRRLMNACGITGYGPKPASPEDLIRLVREVEGLALYVVRDPRWRARFAEKASWIGGEPDEEIGGEP